jgi:transposase-like protein
MAFTYPTAIREEACQRMLGGERVAVVATDLGVPQATLYRWKKQALIDAGQRPGVKSYEPDELARSRRRIKDLEAELELVKAASALFNGEEVILPKGSAQS